MTARRGEACCRFRVLQGHHELKEWMMTDNDAARQRRQLARSQARARSLKGRAPPFASSLELTSLERRTCLDVRERGSEDTDKALSSLSASEKGDIQTRCRRRAKRCNRRLAAPRRTASCRLSCTHQEGVRQRKPILTVIRSRSEGCARCPYRVRFMQSDPGMDR
ncbi:hypothetical protein BD626DRAFT_495487 [Schizophyllum amplum]|uniref:Uncharacterized protein n=1 Tax=Schizophyllum amplum TaxID=97359 RepID=A0A550CE71_9AGAR|nr:hypothetical protein BD626DRAFT_495487 [Auriculariopsis ampla]